MQKAVTESRKMTWAAKMVKYCHVQFGYRAFSCWNARNTAHRATTAAICTQVSHTLRNAKIHTLASLERFFEAGGSQAADWLTALPD